MPALNERKIETTIQQHYSYNRNINLPSQIIAGFMILSGAFKVLQNALQKL